MEVTGFFDMACVSAKPLELNDAQTWTMLLTTLVVGSV
jgi:hypothetical protein